MNYGPQWLLRSGYGLLVVYAVDAAGAPVPGVSFATRSVRPLAYADSEPETRLVATGETVDETRPRAVAPEIAGWPEIQRLRHWQTLGYRVRAVVVAAGRGRHVLWGEAVRPRLRSFSEGRGSLEGDRLLLETARFDAAVAESPDLLALAAPLWNADGAPTEWAGSASVVLPAPGLAVYGYAEGADSTLEALDAAGAVLLASGPAAVPGLRLPSGTWSVRASGGSRVQMLTRAPQPTLVDVVAGDDLGGGSTDGRLIIID